MRLRTNKSGLRPAKVETPPKSTLNRLKSDMPTKTYNLKTTFLRRGPSYGIILFTEIGANSIFVHVFKAGRKEEWGSYIVILKEKSVKLLTIFQLPKHGSLDHPSGEPEMMAVMRSIKSQLVLTRGSAFVFLSPYLNILQNLIFDIARNDVARNDFAMVITTFAMPITIPFCTCKGW